MGLIFLNHIKEHSNMSCTLDYPRDLLRYHYFVKESNKHQAKMELRTFKWIVENYTKPGDTILDPMSGIGTVHFANFMGRNTLAIELVHKFVKLQVSNIRNMMGIWQSGEFYSSELSPWDFEAKEYHTMGDPSILEGDCRRHLPWQRPLEACIFCLAPDTPVLMWDLTWKSLGDLCPGDEILSVDEYPGIYPTDISRGIRRTNVLSVAPVILPAYRIELSDGRSFVASGEHRWLGVGSASRTETKWLKTTELRPGISTVRSLTEPAWITNNSHVGGYIAGLLDGEGSIGKSDKDGYKRCYVGFKQKPGIVLDTYTNYLDCQGIQYNTSNYQGTSAITIIALPQVLKLLGTVRPKRLLPTAMAALEGRGSRVRDNIVKVLAVEPVGGVELIGIETSTKTLIANGIISHNSPPYGSLWSFNAKTRDSKIAQEKNYQVGYDDSVANVGNLTNYAAYLIAMKIIYQKCFDSLRSGAPLITVVKDYMYQGRRVPCSRDNLRLCLEVGFQPENWHFRRADIQNNPFSAGNREKRIAAGKHKTEFDINVEDIIVVRKP